MEESVYLRALEMSDLDRIHSWHNDWELYEMLGGPFHFVSRQATQEWLERVAGFSPRPESIIRLAICVRGSDKHVGNIYLCDINWTFRRAEMQIFIGDPEGRSKGYAQSAMRQLFSYAFRDMGLHRIHLGVLADNPAIRSYEKLGFTVEGRLREHMFKHGSWKDVIIMGLFARDFLAAQGENP